jgi:segregation and condensation protein A
MHGATCELWSRRVTTYEVKTRVFEGPLDLLLQLITSRQLEITELSLVEIVSEYAGYLDAMRQLDLEVTSEFLLIAATLIQIKARHLLPDDATVDLDEELALAEERDRLLSRLLACLTFKDVAAVLAHRLDASLRYVPRSLGLDEGITPRPPEVRLRVTAGELAAIAARAFVARPTEPDLHHLDFDLPSVDDAIADLRSRVQPGVERQFDELVSHCERPIEVVAYFLAMLELARWGAVGVTQDHWEDPIVVRHRPGVMEEELDRLGRASEWRRQ